MQDGNKATRCKATPTQLNYLAEFMKNHTDLASGLGQSLQARVKCEALWQKLTAKLNALGGPIKTAAKWKQAWRDMRNNDKKKAAYNRSEFRAYGPGSTGNGLPTHKNFTPALGPVALFGLEDFLSTEDPLGSGCTSPSGLSDIGSEELEGALETHPGLNLRKKLKLMMKQLEQRDKIIESLDINIEAKNGMLKSLQETIKEKDGTIKSLAEENYRIKEKNRSLERVLVKTRKLSTMEKSNKASVKAS